MRYEKMENTNTRHHREWCNWEINQGWKANSVIRQPELLNYEQITIIDKSTTTQTTSKKHKRERLRRSKKRKRFNIILQHFAMTLCNTTMTTMSQF